MEHTITVMIAGHTYSFSNSLKVICIMISLHQIALLASNLGKTLLDQYLVEKVA